MQCELLEDLLCVIPLTLRANVFIHQQVIITTSQFAGKSFSTRPFSNFSISRRLSNILFWIPLLLNSKVEATLYVGGVEEFCNFFSDEWKLLSRDCITRTVMSGYLIVSKECCILEHRTTGYKNGQTEYIRERNNVRNV